MRKLLLVGGLAAILGLAVVFGAPKMKPAEGEAAQKTEQAGDMKLDTEGKKLSYSLGLDVGRTLTERGIEIEHTAFLRGVKDGLTGAEPRLSQQEMLQTLIKFQQEMAARQKEEQAEQASGNLAEAEGFLEENRQKEAVKVTDSGLQYEVLQEGEGASPGPEDTVVVHYRGELADGTEFDSSYSRGEPTTFQVDQVIKGWQEGIQKMKVGGHWKLYLPPELAYGEQGVPPRIGPNQVLIFDVKLLEIKEEGEREAQR